MAQTKKRFQKHQFDDEKDLRQGKAAGKRGHSRFLVDEDNDYPDLDDTKYREEIEFFLKHR